MSKLSFAGRVSFRSSLPNASGPPGESKILSLNPRRVDGICSATGWSQVEPGSLNLGVGVEVVPALHELTPTWTEEGSAVIYPPGFEQIPKRRGAYFYYFAQARAKGKTEQVLVRTSRNPLRGRVELFAPVSLKANLGLVAGDQVDIEIPAI